MERVDYQSLVIQDVINLERMDELNLSPWYQRRSVWNDSQKSYLINTLFERKPIPTLYIRHTIDLEKQKSVKEVVDGQQRIRAIVSFYNNEISALHPDLGRRIKFKDLTNNQKQVFLMTPLPVGYLQGATDSDVIDIFARINSVAKSLNSQEKRNAKYSGAFKQFCISESTKRLEFFRKYGVFTPTDFSRMNEVQFMSDVIVNINEGLSSYSSSKLDQYYKKYDVEFENALQVGEILDSIFDILVRLDPECITDTIFCRQPLFFSLIITLCSVIENVDVKKVQKGLWEIDARYNVDITDKTPSDVDFYNAVSATTQGEKQRKCRDAYIKSFIL